MKFKPFDRSLLSHPVEKRGFVQSVGGAEIFYRFIPAYGTTPADTTKPIIVVINGGPGLASSFYRPLDFDYQNPDSEKNGNPNRFKFLLQSFHIIIADQRGTDGLSTPLDLTEPNLDYHAVARDYSSDTQARDYLAVINALIAPGREFFIIAQSYGGMVGMQYLALPERRHPRGMLFTAAAVPRDDVVAQQMSRRREQLRLNRELRATYPDIEARLARARATLTRKGIDADQIHHLFGVLGKGVVGKWEQSFVEKIEKFETQSREEIEKDLLHSGGYNLLNYILSSSNFTPGYTDRTMAQKVSAEIPFESWMIDENRTFLDSMPEAWQETLAQRIDADPPRPTPMPTVETLRREIAREHLLFTAADNDAFVPADAFMNSIEKYQVPGHTELRTLPGGHNAIFLEAGYPELMKWRGTLPPQR